MEGLVSWGYWWGKAYNAVGEVSIIVISHREGRPRGPFLIGIDSMILNWSISPMMYRRS